MQNVEVINKSSIISLPELFYREDTHPTPSPTNSVSKLSEMYTMFVYPYTNAQFFFTVHLLTVCQPTQLENNKKNVPTPGCQHSLQNIGGMDNFLKPILHAT